MFDQRFFQTPARGALGLLDVVETLAAQRKVGWAAWRARRALTRTLMFETLTLT